MTETTGTVSSCPGAGVCWTTTHSGRSGPGGPVITGATLIPAAAPLACAWGHSIPMNTGTAFTGESGSGDVVGGPG